jgi:hypothetical protein
MNLRGVFDFRPSDAGSDAAKRMKWFRRLGNMQRRLAQRCFSSNPAFQAEKYSPG